MRPTPPVRVLRTLKCCRTVTPGRSFTTHYNMNAQTKVQLSFNRSDENFSDRDNPLRRRTAGRRFLADQKAQRLDGEGGEDADRRLALGERNDAKDDGRRQEQSQ